MGRVLPILFNTDMVRAILDGRKTVTRRVIKPRPQGCFEVFEEPLYIYDTDFRQGKILPPFRHGDILYVRETWQYIDFTGENNGYVYKASENGQLWETETENWKWRPSIHMPKAAARIWLRVTDVRVERLQEITSDQCIAEGIYEEEITKTKNSCFKYCGNPKEIFGVDNAYSYCFRKCWNSTIKKSDIGLYGWDGNPWVWVIGFERCEKPDK